MQFVKRLLLLATIGTMSIVLAGCYGSPNDYDYQPEERLRNPSDQNTEEPTTGLETAPASDSPDSGN